MSVPLPPLGSSLDNSDPLVSNFLSPNSAAINHDNCNDNMPPVNSKTNPISSGDIYDPPRSNLSPGPLYDTDYIEADEIQNTDHRHETQIKTIDQNWLIYEIIN